VESYRTIAKGARPTGEFVDRKSRFIAQLARVGSLAEADEFIDGVRSSHHDARHNVPAWILSDGRERCSDDGEPQRTAGMPTLEVLRTSGLVNVCCVVTRYFGGTLLGPGGLVRAYTAATQEAVAAAEKAGQIVEMSMVTRVTVTIPYAAYGRVERMVADHGGKVRDTIFSEDVQMNCAFLTGTEAPFLHAMSELAAGEDLCVVGEPTFQEF